MVSDVKTLLTKRKLKTEFHRPYAVVIILFKIFFLKKNKKIFCGIIFYFFLLDNTAGQKVS